MTYTLIALLYRKQGTTMEYFMNYYDNEHMNKLIRELAGPDYPLVHTRRYIHRTNNASTPGGTSNPTTPATLLAGGQEQVDFDCIVELAFEDEAACQRFTNSMTTPEAAKKIYEDELNFLDSSKTVVVVQGAVDVSKRE